MKNTDVIRLLDGLKAVKNLRKKDDSTFAYVVGRNIRNLSPVVDSIIGTLTIPEQYAEYEKEYEQERVKVCMEHCLKDGNGECMFEYTEEEKRYSIIDKASFNRDLNNLRRIMAEKYSSTVAEMKANHKQYLDFLEAECIEDIKILTLKESHLPEEISGEEVSNILEMIDLN